jgi:hypothetical protein
MKLRPVLIALFILVGLLLLTQSACAAPDGYTDLALHNITGSPDGDLTWYTVGVRDTWTVLNNSSGTNNNHTIYFNGSLLTAGVEPAQVEHEVLGTAVKLVPVGFGFHVHGSHSLAAGEQ